MFMTPRQLAFGSLAPARSVDLAGKECFYFFGVKSRIRRQDSQKLLGRPHSSQQAEILNSAKFTVTNTVVSQKLPIVDEQVQ